MATLLTSKKSEYMSLDYLTKIYARAISIQLSAERLMNRSIQLGRLAINTEVVAVKAATVGLTFSVIAKEVSALARTITTEMELLEASGKLLASNAVACAARARLGEKYREALALNMTGSNAALVQGILNENQQYLQKVLTDMSQQLKSTLVNAQNLVRLTVHIPVVASMFRIESARGSKSDALLFRGMSNDLVAFTTSFSIDLEHLLVLAVKTLDMFGIRQPGAAR